MRVMFWFGDSLEWDSCAFGHLLLFSTNRSSFNQAPLSFLLQKFPLPNLPYLAGFLLAQCHPSSFQLDASRFILGGLVVVSDFGACELVLATYNSTDHCRPSVQLISVRSEAIWPDSLFQTLETVSLLLICFLFMIDTNCV